jgi:hypothetical protein
MPIAKKSKIGQWWTDGETGRGYHQNSAYTPYIYTYIIRHAELISKNDCEQLEHFSCLLMNIRLVVLNPPISQCLKMLKLFFLKRGEQNGQLWNSVHPYWWDDVTWTPVDLPGCLGFQWLSKVVLKWRNFRQFPIFHTTQFSRYMVDFIFHIHESMYMCTLSHKGSYPQNGNFQHIGWFFTGARVGTRQRGAPVLAEVPWLDGGWWEWGWEFKPKKQMNR